MSKEKEKQFSFYSILFFLGRGNYIAIPKKSEVQNSLVLGSREDGEIGSRVGEKQLYLRKSEKCYIAIPKKSEVQNSLVLGNRQQATGNRQQGRNIKVYLTLTEKGYKLSIIHY